MTDAQVQARKLPLLPPFRNSLEGSQQNSAGWELHVCVAHMSSFGNHQAYPLYDFHQQAVRDFVSIADQKRRV